MLLISCIIITLRSAFHGTTNCPTYKCKKIQIKIIYIWSRICLPFSCSKTVKKFCRSTTHRNIFCGSLYLILSEKNVEQSKTSGWHPFLLHFIFFFFFYRTWEKWTKSSQWWLINSKLLKWTTNIPQKAIKVEEKSFHLRWESFKSIDSVQSYVHLKNTRNYTKNDWITWIREKLLIFGHFSRFSNTPNFEQNRPILTILISNESSFILL